MRILYSVSCPSSNMMACVSNFPRQSACRSLQLVKASRHLQAALETTGIRQDLFKFADFSLSLNTQVHDVLLQSSLHDAHCGLVLEGAQSVKRCPRSTATNLPGSFSWQALWICAAQERFITPTYRETNKQPNLQRARPQLQQAVMALFTSTAQCSSYPSSPLFPLSCLLKPTTL